MGMPGAIAGFVNAVGSFVNNPNDNTARDAGKSTGEAILQGASKLSGAIANEESVGASRSFFKKWSSIFVKSANTLSASCYL
jgi:hypothetical protein